MNDFTKELDGLTLTELKEWLEKRCIDCLFSQHKYFKWALKLVDWHISVKEAADTAINGWLKKNE